MRSKTLEGLKLDVRERVGTRLATGSRWTLGEALRRRARRKRRAAHLSLGLIAGAIMLATGFGLSSGLLVNAIPDAGAGLAVASADVSNED